MQFIFGQNQLNFRTEPHNDNFVFSVSRKKRKTVEMIFQTRYCTFRISAKTFSTNFVSFLAQSPEKMTKSKKKNKKTAKIRENVESNCWNRSIRSLPKIWWKNSQIPEVKKNAETFRRNFFSSKSLFGLAKCSWNNTAMVYYTKIPTVLLEVQNCWEKTC